MEEQRAQFEVEREELTNTMADLNRLESGAAANQELVKEDLLHDGDTIGTDDHTLL